MISVSSNRLIVFSKSIDVGQVKTRMRSVLSEEECLSFYVALLKDTLASVQDFKPILYLSGSGFLPFQVNGVVRFQTGADLGQKMFHAFEQELTGESRVIIIGADSPTLMPQTISNAFGLLSKNDAVFGPAEDGGYYLIGLRTLIPEIFQEVSWGGPGVLKDTIHKIGKRPYALLETNFDVDTPQDLDRLIKILPKYPALRNLNDWAKKRAAP